MLLLVRDIARSKTDLFIAILVGLMAAGLPYGYAIGLMLDPLWLICGVTDKRP